MFIHCKPHIQMAQQEESHDEYGIIRNIERITR